MSFYITSTDITSAYHNNIAAVSKKGRIMTIEIQEGFYCPEDLAAEIQERMNYAVTESFHKSVSHISMMKSVATMTKLDSGFGLDLSKMKLYYCLIEKKSMIMMYVHNQICGYKRSTGD